MSFEKNGEIKVFKKNNKTKNKITADFTGERFGVDDLDDNFAKSEDIKKQTVEKETENKNVSNKD